MPVKDDYLIPEWHAPANVRAFVSTKANSPTGPVMNGPRDAAFLSQRKEWLSFWGDQLVRQWGWSAQPCWATQVHGADVIPADSAYGTDADAIWTGQVNVPCAVMTADCLPVIFCNREGTKVAAAHAGWRGLAGDVLENTVAAMNEPADSLMAWMGPAISQASFEVGPEVRQAFIDHDPIAAEAFVSGEGDRWFADIYLLARQRLNAVGVTDVSGGDQYCTFKDSELCHSYRRDGQASGRMLTAIWLS
ncbi:peptidoglycan editing factor PgeF [Parendozoicomonas haliclonae]|uniref:Purine nucleoside phosphorylase n=1 Tax=Parendozoicomonas haliclonae TaxID=1960125 RepID=A0A1X7AGY2_9GAMM|nr:peptidoglycan editing factor PgeF [Parendozoicomonas haliclonae]SMA34433.1 Laccase domain protein YfiH [Parendozoicomonas haliclonae]